MSTKKKSQRNLMPTSCAVCTECYFDLDRDPRGIVCEHGGPYIGYVNLETNQLTDREDNILKKTYFG